jgi:hypothetical protein
MFFFVSQRSALKAASSCKSALAHTMNFASGGENVAYSVIGDSCGKKAFKVRLRNDTSYQQDHRAFLKRVSLLSRRVQSRPKTTLVRVWGA